MDCEDEDVEVLLKGGQLYSYLAENCEDSFDYFDKKYSPSIQPVSSKECSQAKIVKAELQLMVNEILHSNLLLDEDASFLYGISTELVPVESNIMYKLAIINSMVAITASCSYLYLKETLYLSLPIVLCTVCSSLYNIVEYFHDVMRRKSLNLLHKTLNKLHFYIRKTTQYLHEYDACLFKHHMKFKARNINQYSTNDVLLAREDTEISTLRKVLHQCLLDIIHASKDETERLRDEFPLDSSVDCSAHYLAFSSSDQISLDIHAEKNDFNNSQSTATIEILKNVYLLMQSESLRRLGLCFCPNVWQKSTGRKDFFKVFKVVEHYTLCSNNILQCLEHKYKTFFSPKLVSRTKDIDPKWLDGYSFIHKLSVSLNSVLCEVRMVEDYLELSENDDRDLKITKTNTKLKEIEKEFQETITSLQAAAKYFQKLQKTSSDLGPANSSLDLKQLKDESFSVPTKKTSILVGYSDFTPNDSDRVYLCVTDGEMDNCSDSEVFDDLPSPILPASVLNELKGALLNKKKEFEERESEALKENADYDHYMTFSDSKDQSETLDKTETKVKSYYNKLEPIEFETNMSLPDNHNSENDIFQKNLAAIAVRKAFEFNNCHEEVVYGSDTDDSD